MPKIRTRSKAVPTSRTVAGLDLSADRSAQAVADALATPLNTTYARLDGATYTGTHDFTGATVTGVVTSGGGEETLDIVGVSIVGADGVTVTYDDPTNTITVGKQRRVFSTSSTATLTVDANSYDAAKVTAQAAGLTIAAPTGTPKPMQGLIIRIKDNGTARALTWDAAFRAVGVTLPTTTALGKVTYIGCMWNNDASKWDAIAVAQEA